ncbi:MAG: hypothetical protein J7K29_02865, partial [Candidatus Cloacimonetes bacterium]|nr:hypothetical protein [Candidatus Cloacimonadota bacterium]
FIPMLTNKFIDNKAKHKNIIDLIVISMEDCFKDIHKVEVVIKNTIRINTGNSKVSLWANVYLFLLILIPVFYIYWF